MKCVQAVSHSRGCLQTYERTVVEDITKRGVRTIIEAGDRAALLALFDCDPSRVRRYVTRLAYSPDDPVHASVIDAIRFLAVERAADMPDFFRETIRRHLWGMNEEGGNIDWSAPEIIAAVIAGQPGLFGQFASYMICAALDEPTFHPSLRAAAALLAEADEGLVLEFRSVLENLPTSG